MFSNENELKGLIDRMGIDTTPDPAHRASLRGRMLDEFRRTQVQTTARPSLCWATQWRGLLRSPISRLAAAAALVVAAIVVLRGMGGSSVAWAEVLAKVQQVHSFTYRHQWTVLQDANNSPVVIDSLVHMSSDHGIRQDMVTDGRVAAIVYIPLSGNLMTQVFLPAKNYVSVTLSDEAIQQVRRKTDPRTWIEEFLRYDHTDLGRKDLDGIEVQGMEVEDPRFLAGLFSQAKGRLWVDVRTALPVRVEVEGVYGERPQETRILASDFNWTSQPDPTLFEPNIPADFTRLAEVDVSAGEASLIQGLRSFADLTGGQYPSQLAALTAWREVVMAVVLSTDEDPNAQALKGAGLSLTPTVLQRIQEKTVAVAPACGFYGKLLRDANDVAYYGSRVMRQHPDLVLLRWRQQDGQYRVLFGDLHVETASEPRLRQLEQDGRFTVIMAGPRGPMPIQASGRFTGSEYDRWEITAQDTIEAMSSITLVTWSADRPMTVHLPFAQARLESVTMANIRLAFVPAGEGAYEVNVPVDRLHSMETTDEDDMSIQCRWSVPLSGLDVTKHGYQTPVRSLIPVRPHSSFNLVIVLAPDCRYRNADDASKREWRAFNDMGGHRAPVEDFGCYEIPIRGLSQ